MRTTRLTALAFLKQFVREPLNLVVLLAAPTLLVAGSADALQSFAEIVGQGASHHTIAAMTAGWAASLAAGLSAHYLVVRSRDADEVLRLVAPHPARVAVARAGTLIVLAATAALVSLVALVLSGDHPLTVANAAAVSLSALIYCGIGTAIGASIRDDLAGSLAISGVWMFDALLGPGMGNTSLLFAALGPTHSASTLALPDTHDLGVYVGFALAWAVTMLAVGLWLLRGNRAAGLTRLLQAVAAVVPRRAASTDEGHEGPPSGAVGAYRGATLEVLRACLTDARRNRLYLALLVAVPIGFVGSSFFMFPGVFLAVPIAAGGGDVLVRTSMHDLHGAYMGYIATASLAGLSGLFIVLSSREVDSRLIPAGCQPRSIVLARLIAIGIAGVVAACASLAATLLGFRPEHLPVFVVALLIGAFTWGAIGAAAASLGRLGGSLVMFALPFLDVGIAQDYMLGPELPSWGQFLPSYPSVQVLIQSAYSSSGFSSLAAAAAWVLGLGLLAGLGIRSLALKDAAS